MVERMSNMYKHVRAQQQKMAKRNQARTTDNKIELKLIPEDKPNNIKGDMVIFWEPRHIKHLKADDISVLDASKAPKKWTPVWTGPHRVIGKNSTNNYVIFHREKSKPINTHVNRLLKFEPWSKQIESTSTW